MHDRPRSRLVPTPLDTDEIRPIAALVSRTAEPLAPPRRPYTATARPMQDAGQHFAFQVPQQPYWKPACTWARVLLWVTAYFGTIATAGWLGMAWGAGWLVLSW